MKQTYCHTCKSIVSDFFKQNVCKCVTVTRDTRKQIQAVKPVHSPRKQ